MTDDSAVRQGLRHRDPLGAACAQILDHFLDDAALADIVDRLADDSPRVRVWALHTLGCDRCKEGLVPARGGSLPAGGDPHAPRRPRLTCAGYGRDNARPVGGDPPVRCRKGARSGTRRRPRPPRPQGRRPFRDGLTLIARPRRRSGGRDLSPEVRGRTGCVPVVSGRDNARDQGDIPLGFCDWLSRPRWSLKYSIV